MEQNGRFRRLAPRTLRFDVAESIRSAILQGVLPAGSPLVEARIADEMGVSRAPVREALRKLEEEGLVVSIPYRGSYVTRVSPETMLQIATLRTVLERFAAEQALPRLLSEGLPRLRSLITEMRTAAEEGNEAMLVEHHMAFHRSFYELAGNALLLQFWSIMEGQLRLYLRVNLRTFGDLREVAELHEETLRILESRDLEALKAHLSDHIVAAAERMVHPPQPQR